ncbi:glyoxylase I family protein [Carnobacterium iners]|uniref:Glyoxylase I family protein n=1 Tax=Carnobacterium iners TaxID=1073423 RepID=A0A1X7N4T8_9LACT|nr:VOC family protein [Carnobacterium iners]SEK60225.1 glyoxylase I family protein [Carnobacterium iners]SMH32300.1 glyoxylase I family protein [Carnobacterium iners]
MKLNRIHHVAIIASDYEKSKYFYTDILNLEIIRENYRKERDSYKLDLKIGESEIELFSFPNPPERPTTPEARGLRHLCFSVDDLNKTVAELNQNGIATERIRLDEFTGGLYTFLKDPDGLPIELYMTNK